MKAVSELRVSHSDCAMNNASQPMEANQTLHQAIAAHQQNRLADAERLYRAVLQQQPLNAVALHNLGLIAAATGHFEPALDLIGQSLRLDPSNFSYHVNHIGLLDHLGRHDAAEAAAEKLVAENPANHPFRAHYSQLLCKHGKRSLAVQQWSQAFAQFPGDFGVCFHYASTLESAGNLVDAEARYRDALKANPDFGEAMVNLAGILLRTERTADAVPLLEKAITLLPGNATVLATLGSALITLGRIAEGTTRAEAAAKIAPRDVDVLRNLGYAYLSRGEVEATLRVYRQVVDIAPTNPGAYSTLLMSSLYVEASPTDELKLHRGYQARIDSTIKPKPAPIRQRSPGDRLRVGYVSPDFRNHPVGHFIEPLLANHDRSRFEVHLFSNSSIEDDITARIKSTVDAFHPVLELSFEQLDVLIRKTQIDVLIDLAGHTGANCLPVFATRPAPLQMTYLGYPHTTGLKAIDVRITDTIADPPGESDAAHSETLMRLPGSFGLFQGPAGAPPVAPAPHEFNGHVTFGTVGRIEKWNEPTLANWSAVLNAVSGSRFRIIGLGFDDADFKKRLLERLERAGIAPDRVELVGRKPFIDYLAEVSAIDVILDTFPFNGHTTTLQALYMGVPTVTLAGKGHRSRMGASVLTALGLENLIASDSAGFRRIATNLAQDAKTLSQLRSTMRERMLSSSLTDAPRFARAFESLLVEAWNKRLALQG